MTQPFNPRSYDMHPTFRWLFALVTVACGVFVLLKAAGSSVAVATGLGLIAAGFGLVAP